MFSVKSISASKFYEPAKVDMQIEVNSGYLHKSPARSSQIKKLKSWKRRFFVLSRSTEDSYRLAYYENNERKEKPLGVIDLSKITLMFTSPEKHQTWDWIQKNFKCSPSSVLFIRVETQKHARDYFLVGEHSDEVEGWFSVLVKILKNYKLQNKLRLTEESLHKENKCRSISEPIPLPEPKRKDSCDGYQSETDHHHFWPDERWSAPECIFTSRLSHYFGHAPRKDSIQSQVSDEDDDEEEHHEDTEDNSEYMDMASVKDVLQQAQQEEDKTCLQTKDGEICADPGDSLLACVTKVFDNLKTQSPTESKEEKTHVLRASINGHDSCLSSQDLVNAAVKQDKDNQIKRVNGYRRNSKDGLDKFNGNCASTELRMAPPSKSETHTAVQKDICISRNDLQNSLVIRQEAGKLCVSECKQTGASCQFQKGDQIVAFNDLLIDTVEEIHTYLKRLSKNEVKLTILRHPGSPPLHSGPWTSH